MVSATAMVYGDKKTYKLLTTSNKEKDCVAAQIFGTKPEIMSECAKRVQDLGYKIIDINLGCPAKKITKVGAGSRLLSNPKQVEDVLTAVVKAVSVPVTIKTKLRWFRQHAIDSLQYYGKEKGLVVLRKIAPYYIKGLPNACTYGRHNGFTFKTVSR